MALRIMGSHYVSVRYISQLKAVHKIIIRQRPM